MYNNNTHALDLATVLHKGNVSANMEECTLTPAVKNLVQGDHQAAIKENVDVCMEKSQTERVAHFVKTPAIVYPNVMKMVSVSSPK